MDAAMKLNYHVVDVFTKTRFGGNPLAVVLDADERKKVTFLQALNSIRREKTGLRSARKEEKKQEKAKKEAKMTVAKLEAHKVNLKRKYREQGKREQQRNKKLKAGDA